MFRLLTGLIAAVYATTFSGKEDAPSVPGLVLAGAACPSVDSRQAQVTDSPYGGRRRSKVTSIVEGIHRRARDGEVVITHKALQEIKEINLQKEDVLDILLHLEVSEYLGGVRSRLTGDWMHTFRICVTMTAIYIKVILRENCIVISFHIDRGDDGTEGF